MPTHPESGSNRSAHRSEEHTSELPSQSNLVCRLLLVKNKAVKYVVVGGETREQPVCGKTIDKATGAKVSATPLCSRAAIVQALIMVAVSAPLFDLLLL